MGFNLGYKGLNVDISILQIWLQSALWEGEGRSFFFVDQKLQHKICSVFQEIVTPAHLIRKLERKCKEIIFYFLFIATVKPTRNVMPLITYRFVFKRSFIFCCYSKIYLSLTRLIMRIAAKVASGRGFN